MHAEIRAACVDLLEDYAADDTGHTGTPNAKLQVYPGRPRTIAPPTAFVDKVSEEITYSGHIVQRRVKAEMVVLHGLFDSAEAAAQKDAFADGFLEWCIDRYHAASANSVVGVVSIEDDPNYVPDWIQPENQRTYYATRISLEGFAGRH